LQALAGESRTLLINNFQTILPCSIYGSKKEGVFIMKNESCAGQDMKDFAL